MNNFSKNKSTLLTESYEKALPLWLSASIKPYKNLKVVEIDDTYVIEWKGKGILGAAVENDEVQVELIDRKDKTPDIMKIVSKKITKVDDIRKILVYLVDKYEK